MKMELNKIYHGDSLEVLKTFPDESIDCVMTSPPYWALRDYGISGQLGLEPTFQEYITKLCDIFDEIKRVLKKTGTIWVNLGDTYGGTGTGQEKSPDSQGKQTDGQLYPQSKARNIKNLATKGTYDKCLCQIPSRFAIEMCNRGWILRNRIIWHKPNCMPSSVKDRFTVDYEDLFFFVKNKKYWFETQYEPLKECSIKRAEYGWYGSKLLNGDNYNGISHTKKMGNRYAPEQGRNKRCVWSITTKGYSEAHFATFPEELVETPIKAGCPEAICKKCGKPRTLIIETSGGTIGKSWHDHSNDLVDGMTRIDYGSLASAGEEPYQRVSKGYTDCGCNVGFKPGIVLDPFMGAGTTVLVALKLNRKFVGIELNQSYIDMAYKRIKPYLEQTKLTSSF